MLDAAGLHVTTDLTLEALDTTLASIFELSGWFAYKSGAFGLGVRDEEEVFAVINPTTEFVWLDQSGNNNDFSQSTATSQPILESGVWGTKPGVTFDGTDDFMEAASVFLSGTSGYVAALMRIDAEPNTPMTLLSSSQAISTVTRFITTRARQSDASPFAGIAQRNDDTTDAVVGNATISTDDELVMEFWSDGDDYFISIDGVAQTLTALSGTSTGDWWGDTSNLDNLLLGALADTPNAQFLDASLGVLFVTDDSVPGATGRANIRDFMDDYAAGNEPTFDPTTLSPVLFLRSDIEAGLRITGGDALTAASISTDTEYDFKATFDGTELELYVDGSTVAEDAFTGNISTNTSDVTIESITGTIGQVRIGSGSVDTPSYVLDLQFEPAQVSQSTAGTDANGWVWEGTVVDQSSESNDATYTFVRDTSDITVTVGPVTAVDQSVSTGGTEDVPEVVEGGVTSPIPDPYDPGDWAFPLTVISDPVLAQGDIPGDLLALSVVLTFGLGAGLVVFLPLRMPGAVFMAAGLGFALGVWMTPMENVMLIPALIMGFVLPFIMPRAWERV